MVNTERRDELRTELVAEQQLCSLDEESYGAGTRKARSRAE